MRILIIEDDIKLNDTIRFSLENEGYLVDSCYDGSTAQKYMKYHCADLILLDRMLPQISGTELLKTLRDSGDHTPVLILTALGTLKDRVEGLDMGADDYLVKPFAMEELLARVRSLIRRSANLQPNNVLSFGDLSFCEESNELSGPDGNCTLSQREGNLLEVFLRSNGQTIQRSQLINKVWGISSEIEDGNLDNYIFFLRRRFKSLNSKVTIQTMRGIGYRLNSKDKD